MDLARGVVPRGGPEGCALAVIFGCSFAPTADALIMEPGTMGDNVLAPLERPPDALGQPVP
jgi:hypothetical protein